MRLLEIMTQSLRPEDFAELCEDGFDLDIPKARQFDANTEISYLCLSTGSEQ